MLITITMISQICNALARVMGMQDQAFKKGK